MSRLWSQKAFLNTVKTAGRAKGIGSQAFVRIVARDKAGNSSIACTLDPIHLENASRPRAFIRGVRTETGSATDSN